MAHEQEVKEQYNLAELRKIIAQKLYNKDKTIEELEKEIENASFIDITNALKQMLKLKLITKNGYPVKYSLSKEIYDTLEKRKNLKESDKNKIRVSIIIESKSDDKSVLRNSMEQILDSLKKDEKYNVYDAALADIEVHDDLFSTFIEAEVSCFDLNSLFKLIYYYGVTNIEVLKPDKLNVTTYDLQESLNTIVDMTHGYADMIFKLKKQNSEILKSLKKK